MGDVSFYKVDSEIPYKSKNFIKIIDFFLFNCPARHTNKVKDGNGGFSYTHANVSVRGKTFEERGFRGGGLLALCAAMKRGSYKGQLGFNFTKGEIGDLTGSSNEFCYIVVNDNMSQTDKIFYMIRNALAHGSFSVVNKIYSFESNKKGKVKARIRLRESTLLNWISLCSMSLDEVRKYKVVK